MKKIELWQHQKDSILELKKLLSQGKKNILIVLPTGAGKTAVAAYLCKILNEKKLKMAFIAHREELIDQSHRTMQEIGINCIQISAGRKAQFGCAPMSICSIQTLVNRAKSFKLSGRKPAYNMNYVFWDEAHHIKARTWKEVKGLLAKWYPNVVQIGLTATPIYADGSGLGDMFEAMIDVTSTKELIEDKKLSPYVLYSTKTDLAEIRKNLKKNKTTGDFDEKAQSEAVKGKLDVISGETVALYLKYAKGEKAIFFGIDTEHSKRTAETFCKNGVKAVHVDGKMDKYERKRKVADYRDPKGETLVLCNYGIVNEGFDVPETSAVILARHTCSVVFYLQALGRAMRYKPNKVAKIIDQAANWKNINLQFPDTDRVWHLDMGGKDSRKKTISPDAPVVKMRKCIPCDSICRGMLCPLCGEYVGEITEVIVADDDDFGIIVDASNVNKPKDKPARPVLRQGFLNSEVAKIYKEYAKNPKEYDLLGGLTNFAIKNGYKKSWANFKYREYISKQKVSDMRAIHKEKVAIKNVRF